VNRISLRKNKPKREKKRRKENGRGKKRKKRGNRESNMWSRITPQQGCAHRRVLDDFSQLNHYARLRGKCAVAGCWKGVPTMGTYIPPPFFPCHTTYAWAMAADPSSIH
jgi:hypothetical protein